MENTTNKKPVWTRLWFWVVCILFVVAFGVASNGSEYNSSQNVGNTTKSPQVASGEAQRVQEPRWQVVKTWSGSGIKKTEPFTITGSQWRVVWKNKRGYLGVYVYELYGNSLPDMLVNTTDVTSDTSYAYKSGEFYLNVNASGSWEITVEELK